jgi:hypothetical protein
MDEHVFKQLAQHFDWDTRSVDHTRSHKATVRREKLVEIVKQNTGNKVQSFSYEHIDDHLLNSKERYRKYMAIVKKHLREGKPNTFEPGTKCHGLYIKLSLTGKYTVTTPVPVTTQLTVWQKLARIFATVTSNMASVIKWP